MKKIILTVAAVFAFGFANAQDKKESTGEGYAKGNVFLTGAVGFGSEKTGDVKESSFTFAPAVGFFVTSNIAVGARLEFTSTKQENPPADDIDMSTFNAEVFGRYYFTPASKFSVFGEVAVGMGTYKWEQGPLDYDGQTVNANVGAGISYFLSDHWSMEANWAGLGFSTDDNGGDGAEKTSTFGLNVDLRSFGFGVNYKF